MSRYFSTNNRKRKSRRERIGFYTAFAICLVAIFMAVYSTYNTVTNSTLESLKTQTPTQSVEVNEPVYGVTETIPAPTIGFPETDDEDSQLPTVIADEPTAAHTEPASTGRRADALETMLSVDLSLGYPTKTGKVLREYTEDSVYFKTLNVWKPHTGTDFEAELGDDVFAMTAGEVTSVRDDKMFGKTVEISVNNIVCVYSGLGSVKVKKGDSVERADVIATAGAVPFEASDKNHIHVEVKAGGTRVDPLNFMGSDE